jgi:O-acetyl-ADP-ribose deacetylase (regulator of RNase III)
MDAYLPAFGDDILELSVPSTQRAGEGVGVSADPRSHPIGAGPFAVAAPRLVLCAVDDAMARAWQQGAADHDAIHVHRGSVIDVGAQAVVSPANSYGWMRGGIDGLYAELFPDVEATVRSAILALHGGELPVGEAMIVPTGVPEPGFLISAPTMREPGTTLPHDTVNPYLAALAVFRLWRDDVLDDGLRVREVVGTIAMPGLGTGVGGVAPQTCARQVIAAWDAIFP